MDSSWDSEYTLFTPYISTLSLFQNIPPYRGIGKVLRPKSAAESDIKIQKPHEIPIPDIYVRRPTVPNTKLMDNSSTNNNANDQTNSRTEQSRAAFSRFRRPSLKLIPSVAAIDHNSDVSDNDESGESKLW